MLKPRVPARAADARRSAVISVYQKGRAERWTPFQRVSKVPISTNKLTAALAFILLITLNGSATAQQQNSSVSSWLIGTWAGTQTSEIAVLLTIIEKDGKLQWERTLSGTIRRLPLRDNAKAAGSGTEKAGGIVELTGQYAVGGAYTGDVSYSLLRVGENRLTGNVVGSSNIVTPVQLQKQD